MNNRVYLYSLYIDDGCGIEFDTLYIVHEFVYEGRFSTGGLGPPNPMINVKVKPHNKPANEPWTFFKIIFKVILPRHN